jgi:hypothetical protein
MPHKMLTFAQINVLQKMKEILRQVLMAALLVGLQVLLLDNLQLRGAISTLVAFNVYYFYILLMPARLPQIYLLIAAFFLGLSVDLFADTLGIHAAACVFAGFVRIQTLPIFVGAKEQSVKQFRPSIHSMGLIPFLYYALVLSLCFHFALCMLEVFTMHKFYVTLFRIILTTIVNTLFIMVFQIMFAKKR